MTINRVPLQQEAEVHIQINQATKDSNDYFFSKTDLKIKSLLNTGIFGIGLTLSYELSNVAPNMAIGLAFGTVVVSTYRTAQLAFDWMSRDIVIALA